MSKYDLYCDFDIEQHKKTYIHYLEVIMFEDGHIEYAVPSHQEKLVKVLCDKLQKTRQQVFDMCPDEYAFDVITWLCNMTGCVSIWTDGYEAPQYPITDEQLVMLKKLKSAGIYEGEL